MDVSWIHIISYKQLLACSTSETDWTKTRLYLGYNPENVVFGILSSLKLDQHILQSTIKISKLDSASKF